MKSTLSSIPLLCCSILFAPPLQPGAHGQQTATIVRIPSLGGAYVYVNAFNTNGQMTGFSYIPGDRNCHAFLYADGVSHDLGTLGGMNSSGVALNAFGNVVGQADTADLGPHAFGYNGATLVDLNTLGGRSSYAVGINDAGQVAGTSLTETNSNQAFLFANGQLTALGDLGGGSSEAVAINQAGTIAGNSADTNRAPHGFIFRGGEMLDLGSLGGGETFVYALNNLDMVVGESSDQDYDTHAFLFSDGRMIDLGTFGGNYSWAVAVNDLGKVVGAASVPDNTELHAFIYADGILTDLGTLGGTYSEPSAINNADQVVGYSTTASGSGHAFLWERGTLLDLNNLLPPDSGWELTDARFINDSGQIVGYGYYHGSFAWFLLKLETANRPPLAVVDSEITAECFTSVTIDGSASNDPDGDKLTFEWTEAGAVLGNESKLTTSFSFGDHTVTLRVADPSGASSEATVVIHAVDTTPPTIACPPPVTASADSTCMAAVPDFIANLQVTDNCTPLGELRIVQDPPAGTLVGPDPQTVTLTVTDSSGNTSTCTTLFTVADTTAPKIILVTATPSVITPPNHQMVPVKVSVLASDSCDPAPVSRVVSVTCNEPVAPDAFRITGPLTLALEASRDSSGTGRVYSILIKCADAAGNFSLTSVQVTVPKGHGNGGGSAMK